METLTQRLVYSVDGVRWRVREALAHDIPGAQASSCLIFDGGNVCRRFWRYPQGWADLSDEAVLQIMEPARCGESEPHT